MEYLSSNELNLNDKGIESSIGVSYLRFILMIFVCFWNYGIPEPTGFVAALSGFATPCFFILSGYFVLTGDRELRMEKIVRKLKRTLLCIVFVLVLYIILSVVICMVTKTPITITRRNVFEFVVLNMWPLMVGKNIWFIQSLLYAYIVLYIADRLKLMKFYRIVLIILFVFMLLTGEFAGIIHFNFLGYPFIPGGWLTRALPYILLGKLLRDKTDALMEIRVWKYLLLFLLGGVLALGEIILLGRTGYLIYEGHMIGYGVMAFAACGLAISKPACIDTRIAFYDTALSGMTYILMDPLYYVFAVVGYFAGGMVLKVFALFGGIISCLLSAVLAFALRKSFMAKYFYSNYHIKLGEAELNDIFGE